MRSRIVGFGHVQLFCKLLSTAKQLQDDLSIFFGYPVFLK